MNREELTNTLQTPPLTWPSRDIALSVQHDFRCAFCGHDLVASVEALDLWQIDHLHPKSDARDDALENLVLSCKLCNWLKMAYIPRGTTRDERIADAWRYIQPRLAKHRERWEKVRDAVATAGVPSTAGAR
jgi:5-methylcytosine-specific restriction endonuclease McrA